MQTTSALQYSRSFLNSAGRSWCEISPDMSLSQEEVISQPRLLITISHVVGLFTGVNSRAPWNTTPFTIQSRAKGFTLSVRRRYRCRPKGTTTGYERNWKQTILRSFCCLFKLLYIRKFIIYHEIFNGVFIFLYRV